MDISEIGHLLFYKHYIMTLYLEKPYSLRIRCISSVKRENESNVAFDAISDMYCYFQGI